MATVFKNRFTARDLPSFLRGARKPAFGLIPDRRAKTGGIFGGKNRAHRFCPFQVGVLGKSAASEVATQYKPKP